MTSTIPRRLRTPLAVTAAAMLVAVACSAPGADETAPPEQAGEDAEGPGDGQEDTPTGEVPDIDADAINVGVLAPTTGTVAASGQDMLNGWNLYWDEHGSSVAGREIESVHEDTAGDPSTGLNKAQRLVGDVGVDMLVGPLLANVGLAVAEEMNRQQMPVLLPIVSADDLTQREQLDWVLRPAGWTSSQTTHVLGEYVAEQGYERAVTICNDYAFGHESCGGFANTFTDAGGEVVEQLWNPLGTQDFSTYIAEIQQADPDVVFSEQVGADSVRLVQAWSSFGLTDEIPLFGNDTLLDQSLLRNMGDEAIGLQSIGRFTEGREAPATQEFVNAYLDAYDELPSYYAAAMYTAARWVAEAVEAVDGDVSDGEAFLDAVRDVQLDDSPMGPMSLDEYGNPIQDVDLRRVERRDDGRLWNVSVETFESVGQFWTYDPDEFLDQPVYSREYQGIE
ncbi:ABC transporter substrate-binding protein [Actinobacteria bacterium YIM 96077]|uniref:ABC transporter substrate-binding protein n=1 Tax=Phytoactinopolyspora halophila TaxID=1981511 RepID=A0A329QN49_9ACTN|nr:ABC transporter substrate-binding protein [Phytoactinopolyspora halophila]AYY12287.1 ABC transporter substrate-binding protein [Actinobacteria bacterium YIM 96077]RAW13795.1 ABC transporter substrate-binding protein [Phytoactinopolyspora halophila]